MRQRYFLIEPQYSDPDTFCHFITEHSELLDLNARQSVEAASPYRAEHGRSQALAI